MKLLTREALLSFRRAPLLSALSITTIAFSLFTLGLFGLVAINLREALRGLEERVEIVAFVLRGTPAETITLATQDIAAFPEVQDVAYVTEEQALERARARAGGVPGRVPRPPGQPAARLDRGPAQGRLPRRGDTSSASPQRLRGFGFVDDVRFGREWVQKLDHLRNITGIVGLVIGLAFAAVAVVIIGVTIRLTLLQRAREISIMRLVGATNWFIRGPFLLEGALKGLLGGLLSLVLCYAGYLPVPGPERRHLRGADLLPAEPDGRDRRLRRAAGARWQSGERGAAPAACVRGRRGRRGTAGVACISLSVVSVISVLSVLLAIAAILPCTLHAQDDTTLESSRRRLRGDPARARPARGAAAAAAGAGARRQRRAQQPRAAAGFHPADRERDRAPDRRARRPARPLERRADPGGGQPRRAARGARAAAGGHLQAGAALHLPGAVRRGVVRRSPEPLQVPLPHQPAGPEPCWPTSSSSGTGSWSSATPSSTCGSQLDRSRQEREAEVRQVQRSGPRPRAAAAERCSARRAAPSGGSPPCRRTRPGSTALLAALERARRDEAARGSLRGGGEPGRARSRPPASASSTGRSRATIVYRFGRDTLPSGGIIRWNGVGIAAAVGTPVRAVEAGKVRLVGQFGTYGLTIVARARQRLLLGLLPPAVGGGEAGDGDHEGHDDRHGRRRELRLRPAPALRDPGGEPGRARSRPRGCGSGSADRYSATPMRSPLWA